MGAGQTSGQQITIENKTRFYLELMGYDVVHGKAVKTPDGILQRSSSYLQNSGKNASGVGSEIIYKYQICGAPDKKEWYLKIHSVGAYNKKDAGLGLQILKEGSIVFRQNLWDFQPDEYGPVATPNPECPFAVTIPEIKDREDLGSGFYEISVVVAMREILIKQIFENGEEVLDRTENCGPNFEEDFASTSAIISNRQEWRTVTNKVDPKWGLSLDYSSVGGLDTPLPQPAQITGDIGITTVSEGSCTMNLKVESDKDVAVIFQKSFEWVLPEEIPPPENLTKVKVTSERKVYCQKYVGQANGWPDNVDVGHVERYETIHNASYI